MYRQNAWKLAGCGATAALLALRAGAAGEPAGSGGAPTSVTTRAMAALSRLRARDYSGAAAEISVLLKARPGDPLLDEAAGAMFIATSDYRMAEPAFRSALTRDGADGLALYGLGLALLGEGRRQPAQQMFDRARKAGENPEYSLLAERYVQWLSGASVQLAGAGFSPPLRPSAEALDGISDLRRGRLQAGEQLLDSYMNSSDGRALQPDPGPCMSFNRARPLVGAQSAVNADIPIEGASQALQGVVELSPQPLSSGAAYVAYSLDGQSLSLVNVSPFTYDWNTTRASNGWHTLGIAVYDSQARLMDHSSRRVLVANSDAEGVSGARLRQAIWSAMALRPDRYECAMALGQLQQAQGKQAAARLDYAVAAADNPTATARAELAALGGIGPAGNAVWSGRRDEKVVALTFDDGPVPGITEQLLQVLKQWQAPATFFVIGRHVAAHPELARAIADAGMEIGNHSFTHPNLTRLPEADIARQVMETQAAVLQATGELPRFLRPPGGDWNSRVAGVVRSWGLTPCMWSLDAYDSEVIGAQQTVDTVLRLVRPGAIILMHNGTLSTLEALPSILRELRAQGYTFATVSELQKRLAGRTTSAVRTYPPGGERGAGPVRTAYQRSAAEPGTQVTGVCPVFYATAAHEAAGKVAAGH